MCFSSSNFVFVRADTRITSSIKIDIIISTVWVVVPNRVVSLSLMLIPGPYPLNEYTF